MTQIMEAGVFDPGPIEHAFRTSSPYVANYDWFIRESAGQYGESIGKTKLYVNDKAVAEGPMKTQPGKFTLSGDGLCVGRDSGDNVSQEYKAPGEFKGGTILGVGVSIGKQEYQDLARAAAAAFAVE